MSPNFLYLGIYSYSNRCLHIPSVCQDILWCVGGLLAICHPQYFLMFGGIIGHMPPSVLSDVWEIIGHMPPSVLSDVWGDYWPYATLSTFWCVGGLLAICHPQYFLMCGGLLAICHPQYFLMCGGDYWPYATLSTF